MQISLPSHRRRPSLLTPLSPRYQVSYRHPHSPYPAAHPIALRALRFPCSFCFPLVFPHIPFTRCTPNPPLLLARCQSPQRNIDHVETLFHSFHTVNTVKYPISKTFSTRSSRLIDTTTTVSPHPKSSCNLRCHAPQHHSPPLFSIIIFRILLPLSQIRYALPRRSFTVCLAAMKSLRFSPPSLSNTSIAAALTVDTPLLYLFILFVRCMLTHTLNPSLLVVHLLHTTNSPINIDSAIHFLFQL